MQESHPSAPKPADKSRRVSAQPTDLSAATPGSPRRGIRLLGRPASPWERIPESKRKALVWTLWFVTWVLLLAGLFDRGYYRHVVALSVGQAIAFWALHRFRVSPFPVQVRCGYALWVALGTYVPYLTVLMYITTIGLVGNLFFKYCPLARMMYLLPWNRAECFSLGLVKQVFLAPPVDGRFALRRTAT